MLDPDRRELLLDALRPPSGYRLDIAVGTTYTLDLHALLLAPLAFAFFETSTTQEDETTGPDPVALLAALREASDRLHVFCQAGRIAVPRQYRRVMALVENAVHPVSAPKPGGIFHPKVWALRFAAEGEPHRYRLISLSRNLTFDRSWDTLVRLEGSQADGAPDQTDPLTRLVRTLPTLAVRPLHTHAQAEVEQLADELASVRWELPEPFREARFHVLGLPGSTPSPFAGRIDRLLVISPFLGPGALNALAPNATTRHLVSRPESLDAVGSAALGGYDDTFVLATPAQGVEPEEAGESTADASGMPLSGLHAKVYIADVGWNARVLTGSANATEAALTSNVEFLVELEGPKSRCGVDTVLTPSVQGQPTLRDLLEAYVVQNVDPIDPDERELLLRDLERLANDLAAGGFRATVEPTAAEDAYMIQLQGDGPLPPDASARARPVTSRAATAVSLLTEGSGTVARFANLSLEGITSFFAIELTLARGDLSESAVFVVNAELIGAPTDRLSRLLTVELGSRRSVLRYLLLLLALGELDWAGVPGVVADGEGAPANDGAWTESLPLLESLVRALSRSPDKLNAVDRLVLDLERTAEGRALLPEDFLEVWEAFRSVRESATA
jgi:hypothetical protein